MTSIDTNVDNYTISELLAIIEEKDLDATSIKAKTDKLITQFNKTNPILSSFFFGIQSKLLQNIDDNNSFNKETDECINRIKEEIKLMMYNKKQTIE